MKLTRSSGRALKGAGGRSSQAMRASRRPSTSSAVIAAACAKLGVFGGTLPHRFGRSITYI
jgi:hypothetical protein